MASGPSESQANPSLCAQTPMPACLLALRVGLDAHALAQAGMPSAMAAMVCLVRVCCPTSAA